MLSQWVVCGTNIFSLLLATWLALDFILFTCADIINCFGLGFDIKGFDAVNRGIYASDLVASLTVRLSLIAVQII